MFEMIPFGWLPQCKQQGSVLYTAFLMRQRFTVIANSMLPLNTKKLVAKWSLMATGKVSSNTANPQGERISKAFLAQPCLHSVVSEIV